MWDTCLPHQMLVFDPTSLPLLLTFVVNDFSAMGKKEGRFIPANVIFLWARYAHSFGAVDMLDELAVRCVNHIQETVKVLFDARACRAVACVLISDVSRIILTRCLRWRFGCPIAPRCSTISSEIPAWWVPQ